jgi:hypothetical protein
VPTFTALTAGTGFSTMIPADPDSDAWDPGSSHHPDQEFNHVVKISGQIPTSLTAVGDYTIHLETFDGDSQEGGDCGFADWNLHVTPATPSPSPAASTSPANGTLAAATAPGLPKAGSIDSHSPGAPGSGLWGIAAALLVLTSAVTFTAGRWVVLLRRRREA